MRRVASTCGPFPIPTSPIKWTRCLPPPPGARSTPPKKHTMMTKDGLLLCKYGCSDSTHHSRRKAIPTTHSGPTWPHPQIPTESSRSTTLGHLDVALPGDHSYLRRGVRAEGPSSLLARHLWYLRVPRLPHDCMCLLHPGYWSRCRRGLLTGLPSAGSRLLRGRCGMRASTWSVVESLTGSDLVEGVLNMTNDTNPAMLAAVQ